MIFLGVVLLSIFCLSLGVIMFATGETKFSTLVKATLFVLCVKRFCELRAC
jgi:hypothetical protein